MKLLSNRISLRSFSALFLLTLSLLCLSCRAEEAYPDLMTIGEVRGKVPPAGDATRFRARLNQETVVVKGLVHQVLRWRTRKGDDSYGMLIQNLPKDADGDPDTSDGLLVYLGRDTRIPQLPQGDYSAKVGDLLTLRGKVNERYGLTELSDAKVLAVKSGGDVDKQLPSVKLELPKSFTQRQHMLEKLESMRVELPAGAVTVSGTHPQLRTWDDQLWVIPPSNPAAQRENPAARRRYRAAHPLSVAADKTKGGNGQFLVIGSLGLVERLQDRDVSLPPLYAGTTFKDPIVGGIHYSWGEYILQAEHIPVVAEVPERPSQLPEEDFGSSRIRVAAYNVENLYDFVDDPFDDCDFQDDEGCPGSRFPLDYIPISEEIYRARIRKIAHQIVEEMGAPDIIMIGEAEDQDIGKVVEGRMVYGDQNNADGSIDDLQEVALEIVAAGGPVYTVMQDRDGADDRGIICAWMVQTSHLKPVDPAKAPEIFGENPALPSSRVWLPLCDEVSNPKAFNAVFKGTPDRASEMTKVFSRSVQVLLLQDTRNDQWIWLMANHFSAGPDRRVARRTQQAAVNAQLSQVILKQDPQAIVLLGGDLNVFPRPDDPRDPPSDQLATLYDAGLYNVSEWAMEKDPAQAYSYIYKGVAGTLDHFFLSEAAKARLRYAAYLKLNSGSPEAFPDALPLRASDHDPLLIELAW